MVRQVTAVLRFCACAVLLLLGGCARRELLPPLAEVEVPAIEYRKLPEPQPAPVTLVGKTRDGIRDYLGTPDLVRHEAPAEIWRYGDSRCGVYLYFYAGETGDMQVEHVDTVIADTDVLTPPQCLNQLRLRNENAGN